MVSAVRASGAEVTDALPLARQLQNMGMQLYGMQPPTGYSMKADAWVNSSALLGRMNFALALTGGKLKGVQVDSDHITGPSSSPGDPQTTLVALETSLLAGDVSRQTHDTIAAQMNAPSSAEYKNYACSDQHNRGTAVGIARVSAKVARQSQVLTRSE